MVSFLQVSPSKRREFFFSLMCAAQCTHLILRDLISQITYSDEYTSTLNVMQLPPGSCYFLPLVIEYKLHGSKMVQPMKRCRDQLET
jgi:hypothetical protein